MRFILIVAPLLAFITATVYGQPELTYRQLDDTSYELSIALPVPEKDALYADYISLSVDHPDITLSEWRPSLEPVNKYDVRFKKTKKMFVQPFTISLQISLADPSIDSANLHMNTFYRSQQKNEHQKFPLSFTSGTPHETPVSEKKTAPEQKKIIQPNVHSTSKATSFQQKIQTLFTETESWWFRLVLALLLGFLLSLTPCIYPMIPITIGVLQSQGTASVGRNVLIALTYVIGIAVTFATFGTIAALSGKMFGSFMHNPIVIISIIALLAYLAGSMIGLYNLYLPPFMRSTNLNIKKGSLFSIFLFGAASGTVASPCLSPGLVLLLSLVTAVGNIALGFALLFCFGVGLGMPLLVIGTFSGSLSALPKAGNWMMDVKQFFGFIMLATCLYFLANILPLYMITWISMLLSIAIGIFYFRGANKARSLTARTIKNIIGILLIALSVYLAFEAYKQTDIYKQETRQYDIWLSDYDQALAQATSEQKKMLINISAPYCSLCKAIERNIFTDSAVRAKLKEFVTIKIDDIETNETTQKVQKKFTILGAPTILIYDPGTDRELKRWEGELYELTPSQFRERLQ
jgi:thioredoxin:protein disulfide reductase